MDADSSLDEPLHLEILNALAANLAHVDPAPGDDGKANGNASPSNIDVLLEGLPIGHAPYDDGEGWVRLVEDVADPRPSSRSTMQFRTLTMSPRSPVRRPFSARR